MRARLTVLVSLCVSVLALSTACSNASSPADILTPPGDTLSSPSSSVVAIVVFPTQVKLQPGQDTALAVTAVDSTGNATTTPSLTWATSDSSVATVSSTGAVKAVGIGSATITALGAGRSGTSVITVAQGTTPTDSVPTDSQPTVTPTTNECGTPKSGWIWCDDFEQNRLSSYFEYLDDNGSFVRANGVGVDGSYGMRVHFAQGQTSAGALHLAFGKVPQSVFKTVDAGTTAYREIYWRMYVKNQPGWVGGGGDKLSRAISFASSSSWAEAAIAHVWASSSNENYLMIEPASGTDASGNLQTTTYNDFPKLRWIGSRTAADPTFDAAHIGQWHCVEAHAKLNDPGQSNGLFEFWIDGKLEAQSSGLNWVGNFSTYGFNAVFFENYWNAGATQAEDRYFDDIVVSTKPIGCMGQ